MHAVSLRNCNLTRNAMFCPQQQRLLLLSQFNASYRILDRCIGFQVSANTSLLCGNVATESAYTYNSEIPTIVSTRVSNLDSRTYTSRYTSLLQCTEAGTYLVRHKLVLFKSIEFNVYIREGLQEH